MNKLLTISDIQQAIQSHTLSLLLIKAPNCGVCTVVENQLKILLNENQEIYAVQANIGAPLNWQAIFTPSPRRW